ncbi:MAG: ABC transporter ATP-binding protein [Desulfobacterales bacterium]|nr:ABC transporter ATP-binding protein [Desulfobacterales bacterium]
MTMVQPQQERIPNPIIEADELTKRYRTAIGVDRLSFRVNQGEVFGFLGPNGAGKTTTIRLMLDLLRPSGGTLRLFGHPVQKHSMGIRRRCGYLPGHFKPVETMTAEHFLAFCAGIRQTEDPLLRKAFLKRFELTGKDLHKKLKHLSHGTRQKIGIVQAFFHRPELLILDEPTNGLDPLMQEAFYGLVLEAVAGGATVFFSSHNLAEVEKVCDRVAIIREGRIIACETLANLKRKRFRRLELTLQEPLEDLRIPNAREVSKIGNRRIFIISGDLGPTLAAVSRLPVADVILPEPDLEEVFMAYYKKGENG